MTTTKDASIETKIVRVGRGEYGDVFCRIEIKPRDDREDRIVLSITGVEGPRANGDCKGSCGQIDDSVAQIRDANLAEGWTPEIRDRFVHIWREWHLNDMRAGCQHQRKLDTSEEVEIVSYKLTLAAYDLRNKTRDKAAEAALKGEVFTPNATAKALATLENWFESTYSPPDADSPLSGCYEVDKRETKTVGWVRPNQHPKGLLGKPCPECGYKYGSEWLYEELPADVVEFLRGLPDTDKTPAWV